MKKSLNSTLHKAKSAKRDEFYTQLTDIEKELKHYKAHFKGKVVYCNCDDPRVSNFFHYFSYNFEYLQLKKLIASCYKNQNIEIFSRHDCERAVYMEYEGDKNNNRIPDREEIEVKDLKGDGDFRNEESIELLEQADIVVTNPPFSLFREYIAQLIEYNKKFLVIGDLSAITYKEIFALIKDDKVWTGHDNGGTKWFLVPDKYENIKTASRIKIENDKKYFSKGTIIWFTNLETPKRHEELILYKWYSPEEYPKYDNYNAINIDKVAEIPRDYEGAMGVPITFIDKYSPAQFEILSCNDFRLNDNVPVKAHGLIKDKDGAINGTPTYVRVLVRNKKPQKAKA